MLTFLGEEKKLQNLKSIKAVKLKAILWMALPQPLEAQEEAFPSAQEHKQYITT